MKSTKIKINTKTQKYPIIIGSNLISKLNIIIKENSIRFNKCFLIIDKNIPKNQINKIKKSFKNKETIIYFIDANEKNKNQRIANKILDKLLLKDFSREDCLISVGGGITGDLGGFVASLFKRGMQFINLPTTLLAQVDSCIGGKTGVNTKYGKNLIGTFYQPKLVISDSNFLKTLPPREIICGYGEILKHSLIANKNFYKYLNINISSILKLESPFIEKVITESCRIKKKVVEKDEKEKNFRKILNFGHTFAHAYEATLGYSKKLNHGEAVLLGMKSALNFSLKEKLLENHEYKSIINHIKISKLPNDLKKKFSTKHLNKIISFMQKDKKNTSDKINLILLKRIGTPEINKNYSKKNLKLFLKKELVN
ncbi:3-dehydroquinate synthase [Pelagibacterales bacterium SAG-MED47]|nr:3-dehydroquinate synthase [Pelagibacterales bacterium SAG-MED47]